MSLRDVLAGWIEGGLDPFGTEEIPPDSQRELAYDVYTTERAFLIDAVAEVISASPHIGTRLLVGFRDGDFLQVGAVMDEILRGHLIGSAWLTTELREIQEQDSYYDGDQ